MEMLPPEGLVPETFLFFFRMQKRIARNTKRTPNTEPRMIPAIVPAAKPLSGPDESPPESRAGPLGPGRLRLPRDLPGGGEVNGGGGGAGPLSNEFPSELLRYCDAKLRFGKNTIDVSKIQKERWTLIYYMKLGIELSS